MQKGTVSAKDFEKLFKLDEEQNSQGAIVNDGLSGNAHLLKSADNSVAYKNFTGSQVEEAKLVKDAYNRTIQADWTEEHDPSVTTNLVEQAPSINQEITLSKSHSTTINSFEEIINATKYNASYNITDKQEFTKNKQTTTPTRLDQTIKKSANVSTNQLQSQVGTQNVNSQTYTHQFGTLNMNGPVFIRGNTALGGQKIIIGGPSDTSALEPASWHAHKNRQNWISGFHHDFKAFTLKLPPASKGPWIIQIEISLHGICDIKNQNSQSPIIFGEMPDSIAKEYINKIVNDFFENLQIKNDNVTGTFSVDGDAPCFTIANKYGTYKVVNGYLINRLDTKTGVYIFTFQTALSKVILVIIGS